VLKLRVDNKKNYNPA